MYFSKKNIIFSIILSSLLIFSSCSAYKKTDNSVPQNAQERARKAVTEGRGLSLKNLGGLGNNQYEFATSNPMWRASLEILDFLPMTTLDYSGGVIITDWYNDNLNANDSIKITIRFLSNQVSASSLKIIIHQKKCDKQNNCKIDLLKQSSIETELLSSILKKSSELEKVKK